MKILMIRAPRHEDDAEKGLVWWWRVREDDDSPIEDSTGWEFKKEVAYASAIMRIRELRQEREPA